MLTELPYKKAKADEKITCSPMRLEEAETTFEAVARETYQPKAAISR